MKTTSSTTRTVSLLAMVAGAAILLSACAASGSDDADATAPSPSSAHAARMPGVSGQVAAVSGSTAQVQSRTAQTAVTWTSSTSFDTTTRADATALAVGDCVMVRADASSSGSSSGSADASSLTAASVEITSTGGTTCAGTLGAGGVKSGGGTAGSGSAPSARPTVRPGGFGGAVGQVTAVGSGSFTVAVAARNGGASTPLTVGTTSTTTYAQLAAGTAGDIVAGVCLSATGTKDDTGAITASSIVVTQPVDGACGSGTGARAGSASGSSDPES